MSMRIASNFKFFCLLVITSILFTSCQALGEYKTREQIQSTLNDYNTALKNNDKTLFMSTIDQDNKTIKDAFSASFDWLEDSGFPQSVKLGMTVTNVEKKGDNLFLAHITRDRDGASAAWFFRKTDDKWVISEPTIQESGKPQSTVSGNYTFTTYPIADDVNEKIMVLMPKAQEHVRKDLGKFPDVKIHITIYPFTRLTPLGSDWLSTWQIGAGEKSANDIYIVSPESYSFGFSDPEAGWEHDYETMLAHETARVAYVHSFGNPGRKVDWFFEGLAEYVAGFDQMPDVIAAVQNDKIIPIIDASSSLKEIDLAHFSNLNNWSLAYGLSESLVTFIVEKHGGLDTFWALARSYDETKDMQTAIQDTLGTSFEKFDTSWREWLKEDYIQR